MGLLPLAVRRNLPTEAEKKSPSAPRGDAMFRHALMFFGAAVHNVACEVFIALLRRFRAERLSLALAIPFLALGAALTPYPRGDLGVRTAPVPLHGRHAHNA